MDNLFTAGELVPYSGVYRVTHTPPHSGEEAVTLSKGSQFPQCVRCMQVTFMLVNEMSKSDLLVYSQEL